VFARGCTPGVADDPASITGTITQPRRQPLPAESVVEARLVEESRDAALAAVVARSVQLASGEPGPVPFTLTYAPTALEGGRRYLVQVTIATAGRVRFQGNTSSPVGENGALAGPIQIAVEPVR
jgi:putative lipoprotein